METVIGEDWTVTNLLFETIISSVQCWLLGYLDPSYDSFEVDSALKIGLQAVRIKRWLFLEGFEVEFSEQANKATTSRPTDKGHARSVSVVSCLWML